MFSGPLVIRESSYELWEVVEPFRFTSNTGLIVDVPAGFETDLASVPDVFQSLVPKLSYYSQPAVVHDLLYFRHRSGADTSTTRLQADRILLEGCRIKAAQFDVPLHARRNQLIYRGVRAGGLYAWMTPQEKQYFESDNNDHPAMD